jgi:uncharacterized protein YlxW (UPF0749 family)
MLNIERDGNRDLTGEGEPIRVEALGDPKEVLTGLTAPGFLNHRLLEIK